ncbi:MAG: hypothetical protein WA964_10125 [Ilumatobacter sp.]|uniref:hypothetical protein n=1 Tax=Ilumatobacter sp. TaxID=1967498 RepID=UPI003C768F5E
MSTTADHNTSDGLVGATPAEAAVDPLAGAAPEARRSDSSADRFMRRLLRLSNAPKLSAAQARSAFQKSLVWTAARCLLMYIVFPFVLPPLGIALGVGPAIGIVIGLLAMVSIVYSIRRFWRADHSKRWHYTVFGSLIIVFLIWATIADTIRLFD